MNREPLKAFFLVGPTAVGKTTVAHHLALRDGYDILSADAMLAYRGLDIGTAKPTRRQQDEVPYYGIDLTEPSQSFSVSDYLAAVTQQIEARPSPRRPLLVVGGSGLYIRALLQGLHEGPAPDPVQREEWEAMAAVGGAAALREELRRRAPAWLDGLPDPDNPRRLIRALEWTAAGVHSPPRSWQRQPVSVPVTGLGMASAALRERIAERVHQMVDEGLWQETAALKSSGGLGRTARQAIGYAEALALLEGECSETDAIQRIILRTGRLAKRQMTWFRHQIPVEWVACDGQRPLDDIMAEITGIWARTGPSRMFGLERLF